MISVSVVIPVKDGGPLLERVLDAAARQRPHELIVIDSGSRDDSPQRARAAGAQVIEIEPREFGHGRTRNLGAERASGDLIAFLTQDAVPVDGWLDALRESFRLADRVGAAYGPHLPHDDTSPMIARELTEFFAGFSPNGSAVVQGPSDPVFLSNVNACYARACWEQIRFPDVPYAEDQAFAAALLEAGWVKVSNPRAGVLHAHDYGQVEFMRRYFDEYRGLRETLGHVEPISARGLAGTVRRQVAGDRRWMRERGWGPGRRARGLLVAGLACRPAAAAAAARAVAGGPRRTVAGVRRPGRPVPARPALVRDRQAEPGRPGPAGRHAAGHRGA